MSTIDYNEFDVGNIYIYDKHKSLEKGLQSYTLLQAIQQTNYFSSFLSQVNTGRERYVIIRVFTDAEDAKWIRAHQDNRAVKDEGPKLEETSY